MELFLGYKNLCEIPARNAEVFPSRLSHKFRSAKGFSEKTFSEFYNDIRALACGFAAYGVKKESHVAFYSDNRYEWALTDYSLMSAGALSVPRGSDTTPKEQKFIYSHSDASFLIMENEARLLELLAEFPAAEISKIEKVFIMDRPAAASPSPVAGITVYYDELLAKGKSALEKDPKAYEAMASAVSKDDTATIIYTSGTSGNPKGVMLTHANFLHNVRAITPLLKIDIAKGEKTVSILPSWHVYERAYEYCAGAGAMAIFYSSVKTLSEDLANEKPELVCSVPRVWEMLYNRIMSKIEKESPVKRAVFNFFVAVCQARYTAANSLQGCYVSYSRTDPFYRFFRKIYDRLVLIFLHPFYLLSRKIFKPITSGLGGNLRASISGGGSLPPRVDLLFNSIGITLVNAFGMTETSPGTITRNLDRNAIGSIGLPLAETEAKIMTEDGVACKPGEKGIIFVRGPQVMKGYYKNEKATKEILGEDGWLNTGDIGVQSETGDFLITGRSKSTIVLLGAENVEPEPIEEKLKESAYIEHAVVVGQDKKGLFALISMNEEKLRHLAEKWAISFDELVHKGSDAVHKGSDAIMHSKIVMLVKDEIRKYINRANGFKPSEHIANFAVVKKKFSIGDELTQTLKVKRKHVEHKYRHLIK